MVPREKSEAWISATSSKLAPLPSSNVFAFAVFDECCYSVTDGPEGVGIGGFKRDGLLADTGHIQRTERLPQNPLAVEIAVRPERAAACETSRPLVRCGQDFICRLQIVNMESNLARTYAIALLAGSIATGGRAGGRLRTSGSLPQRRRKLSFFRIPG
jgi:hypothetical protein